MDAKEQAEGEKRVRDLLIQPLEDLGLGKPTTTTKDQFTRMKRTLEMGLAWMREEHLAELLAWARNHAGGPNRDRFPIANELMKQADQYRADAGPASPSPLMRNFFASAAGAAAIREGWAPEMLQWFRDLPMGERKWPGAFTVDGVKAKAYDPRRKLEDIELRLSDGRDAEVTPEEKVFRDRRLAKIRECQAIADQGNAERGAA